MVVEMTPPVANGKNRDNGQAQVKTNGTNDVITGITRNPPTYREKKMGDADDWIKGKKKDDGAEGLWRIHDNLYDLTLWIRSHPGGDDWIRLTRGTDITEAFESHHITEKAEQILPKYYVRKAKAPRSCLITFHENGFYRTIKRRVREVVMETGPSWQSKLFVDSLIAVSVLTAVFSIWWGWLWAVLSGVVLQMGVIASHNFFHMKDNWRMYYFNLSLMSYRDWRISHALSHHLYPNTILDLEIYFFQPFLNYMPERKSLLRRLFSWVASPVVFSLIFHSQFLRRIVNVFISKDMSFRPDEILMFASPCVLSLLSGSSLSAATQMWFIIILVSSFTFGVVGLTGAHHHPEIYHEGDHLGQDKDFGLLQLAAVRDRKEVSGSFLVLITFGDHALHHLFPTIDHSRLSKLYPIFNKTCAEFNIVYKSIPLWNLATGMYAQLARSYANKRLAIRPSDKLKQ